MSRCCVFVSMSNREDQTPALGILSLDTLAEQLLLAVHSESLLWVAAHQFRTQRHRYSHL